MISEGDWVYSEYFSQYIRVVKIINDDNWWFRLNGRLFKAQSPLSYFEENE